jgi:hypothetical protein
MSSVAGATAQVTQANPTAVRRAMLLFGGSLVIAALVSQDMAVAVATAATVGAAYYGLSYVFDGRGGAQ